MKLKEEEGYRHGYSDGYAEKDRKKHESFDDSSFADGYIEGYEKGHSEINKKNLIAYQDGYEDGLNNIKGDNIYKADGMKTKYEEGFDEGLKIYNTNLAAEKKIKNQEVLKLFSIFTIISILIACIIYLIIKKYKYLYSWKG